MSAASGRRAVSARNSNAIPILPNGFHFTAPPPWQPGNSLNHSRRSETLAVTDFTKINSVFPQDQGTFPWRIALPPGDGIGPEIVGVTLAETIKEAVPVLPVRPLKKLEPIYLYFLMMYSAAASTLRFF
jgi:hypothetical protein